jgi:DNA-binding response OmpR family regulator
MSHRILVIDDSETERALLTSRLEQSGFVVSVAEDGRAGLRALFERRPDLVLLDVVMPGIDGWKTLEQIREISDVPVIMLTGLDSEVERVRGLRGGADDYVGKPFGAAELAARIDAVLRRAKEKPMVREVYEDGVVFIDFDAHEVRVYGEPVTLTPLEFRLLAALTENSGLVLSRDRLLELVWGITHAGAGDQVKLYVRYLRQKIERDPTAPELIETVRGYGYRYRRPGSFSQEPG